MRNYVDEPARLLLRLSGNTLIKLKGLGYRQPFWKLKENIDHQANQDQ